MKSQMNFSPTFLNYQEFLHGSNQFLFQILERLKQKGEYYSPTHPYEHIDTVANFVGIERHEVITVHIMKHLLGLLHYIKTNPKRNQEVIDEHVGDIINYLLLLRRAV